MPRKGRNIYKRKDSRWEARVYYSGSKRYKAVYGRTYKEAQQKQDRLRISMGITEHTDMLFNAVAESWLEERRLYIKESSFGTYFNRMNKHILPFFNEILYAQVNTAMIANFVKVKNSEGLSAKYIADMVIILKSVASWAEERYAYKNAIKNFKPPQQVCKEPKMLKPEEQKILREYLEKQDDSVSAGIYLGIYTGLRIGELCALKWADINLNDGLITVSKSLQRVCNIDKQDTSAKSFLKFNSPKTVKSNRTIPIPQFLVDKIQKNKCTDDSFLLSGTAKPIEPRLLTYKFKKVLKQLDLPEVTFHSLRHAFATNCLHLNFDLKTLSEILGHSNVGITMKVYVHSSSEQKRECMNKLAAL